MVRRSLVLIFGAFVALASARGTEAVLPPTIDVALSGQNYTIIGAEASDSIGRRLATGDFNGDDIDDILIGVPRGDGPANSRLDAGEAYVVFGSGSLTGTKDLASSAPNVTVYGADAGDFLGLSVAAADVNGNGIDDIILGAPNADGVSNLRLDSGEAYVIFGSASLSGTKDISLGQQSATVYGQEPGDVLGREVAGGDVTGTAVADLLIGAPLADGPNDAGDPVCVVGQTGTRCDAGEAYAVAGPIAGGTATPTSTVYGADAGDHLGGSMAAGNLNGSGSGDLAVSADEARPGNPKRNLAGGAYVLFGPLAATNDLQAGANYAVWGAAVGDSLGRLAVADVAGDGIDDLILAAQFADGPSNLRQDAGEAYVINGSAALSGTKDLLVSAANLTVYTEEAFDELSFVAAGDVNGDAKQDLIFGADDADGPTEGRLDAGELHVVYGSAGLSGSRDACQGAGCAGGSQGAAPDVAIFGADALDDLGPVATGSVNGGAIDDIIIGAPLADGAGNGRSDAGEVYVIFGSGSGADADGDGVPDASDNCPTTANPGQENADGDSTGDACDADADNDGYDNVAEAGAPLCLGAVNDDAGDDARTNDGCPAVGGAETVCTGTSDEDADGFTNDGCSQSGSFSEGQFNIGTNQLGPCDAGVEEVPSASWPSDLVSTGTSIDRITLPDLTSFLAPTRRLDTNPGNPGFSARWDLTSGTQLTTMIALNDLTALLAGTSGLPPMFGGQKAFNGPTCVGS